MLGTPSRYAVPPNVPVAFLACCAAQCPGRFPGMLCCQMPGTPTPYRSSPAFPVCLLPNARPPPLSAVLPNVFGYLSGMLCLQSRHGPSWDSITSSPCGTMRYGRDPWCGLMGGRQSMARPRRHRPSPTACRGRSRSLMTVTERRVKEARREPTQGSTPPGRGLPWRMDHGEGIFLPVALALPDRKRNGALPNSPGGGKLADGPLFLPWA